MMVSEQQGVHMVESDGRMVWVNNIFCMARFGVVGWEVNTGFSLHAAKGSGKNGQTTAEDWKSFVNLVASAFNVRVYDNHKPKHLAEGNLSFST